LRKVCEELGPSFIKLGQIISGRPEWLPTEYINELEKLQDDVPPFPFSDVVKTVEKAYGFPMEQVFRCVDEKPLAAASIGQVHAATLLDGTEVVIKVQRPHLKKMIEADLEIMNYFANLLEEHVEMAKRLEAIRLVDVFRKTIERELDYTWERSHLELFQNVYKEDPDLHVPEVFPKHCRENVLVMERIHGERPHPPERLQEKGFDTKLLAKRGAKIIMKQIFIHGFYHADPHPGNIFILKGNRLCYVDYGMVGRISPRECDDLVDLAHSLVKNHERRAVHCILKLTEIRGDFRRESFERQLREMMDHHLNVPLKSMNLNRLIKQLVDVLRENQLVIKPHFFLMLKALGSVESIGRSLDPNFQMIEHLTPFIKKMAWRRYQPAALQQSLWELKEDLISITRELPKEFRSLMDQASQGDLTLGFEHRGLNSLMNTLDSVSHRLSFAMMVSSLVIGSSLILHAGLPPKWHGVPILGLIGFCLAGFVAFFLLVSMIKKKKW
jgi:ubiquinone biosynthesis protein